MIRCMIVVNGDEIWFVFQIISVFFNEYQTIMMYNVF